MDAPAHDSPAPTPQPAHVSEPSAPQLPKLPPVATATPTAIRRSEPAPVQQQQQVQVQLTVQRATPSAVLARLMQQPPVLQQRTLRRLQQRSQLQHSAAMRRAHTAACRRRQSQRLPQLRGCQHQPRARGACF